MVFSSQKTTAQKSVGLARERPRRAAATPTAKPSSRNPSKVSKSASKPKPTARPQKAAGQPQVSASTATQNSDNAHVAKERQYWLAKSEPLSRLEDGVDVKFSVDDLAQRTQPEPWDGVRNLVARNNLRAMKKGELAFFYHSNTKDNGVVGVMQIAAEATPDETAFDPSSPYYDPKSSREKPKWFAPRMSFVQKLDRRVSLHELQSYNGKDGARGNQLAELQVLRLARLSVAKVSPEEWRFICGLAGTNTEALEERAKSLKQN